MNSVLEPLANPLLEDTHDLPSAEAVLDAFARYQVATEERLVQGLERVDPEEEKPASSEPVLDTGDEQDRDADEHDTLSLESEMADGEQDGAPVEEPEGSQDMEASLEADEPVEEPEGSQDMEASLEADEPVEEPEGSLDTEDSTAEPEGSEDIEASLEAEGQSEPDGLVEVEEEGDSVEPALVTGGNDSEEASDQEESSQGPVRRRRRSRRNR